jgi:hypothetical protein
VDKPVHLLQSKRGVLYFKGEPLLSLHRRLFITRSKATQNKNEHDPTSCPTRIETSHVFGAPHSKDIQLKRAPKYLQYVLGEFAGRDRPVPFV